MDELIQQVSQRTGLPADKARQAAEAVLEFLKARLPEQVGSQLDAFTKNSAGGDPFGTIAAGLGGMFGKKS